VQRLGAGAVVDGELRAGVQLQPREVPQQQVIDAEILEDDGIDTDVVQGGDGLN